MNAPYYGNWKSLRFLTLILAPWTIVSSTPLTAEVTTYNDETAYLNELLRLGYATVIESFEDDTAWGTVRTTIAGGPMTAPSITSQGITWTHNFPEVPGNNITTGPGPARTGNYGFFALPHGNYYSGVSCTVPGACGDGCIGTTPAGTPMFAVGGWVGSNQAKLGVFLDDSTTPEDFGNAGLTNTPKFFGVIDTTGFNKFEFHELEGTGEDAKIIFMDDFTFGMAANCGTNIPPTAAFSFSQTDSTMSFTDASSDTDGTVVERLWDFGDGTESNEANPSHTYATNGVYSVVFHVRDDGNCPSASAPQIISVTSHPPADIAITNPTNGAIVNGTITLEVEFMDLPSSIEQVTYFLDDNEFDNSEENPFSLIWNTTDAPDGAHTLMARLTRFDGDEILSDPVSITIANTPPPTPLETWRMDSFLEADLLDPTKELIVWGNSADPDQDGKNNWCEYVFGGVPTVPDSANMPPSVEMASGPGGEPLLQFIFKRRTNDPALLYTPKVSSSLSNWFSGTSYVEEVIAIPITGTDFANVIVRDKSNLPQPGRVFGRVDVSGTAP